MPKITIKEYQEFTPKTFLVPESYIDSRLSYLFAGLAAEAGEVAGNYAKFCREDFGMEELTVRSWKELGDVLYFTFQLANMLGLDIEDILAANKTKLVDRLARNVIKGDGEVR